MRKPPKAHKLPVQQLVILSICRFAEPIAFTSVFPYLPEMIESFDIPKDEVSKWAGITSAVFSLSQAATGIAWGRASDRFGRKPVILCAMFCVMSTSLFFGFSRSLTWAIIARALTGASNGNVGIMRTAVAELVPYKELQPRAFSIMPLVWTIGSIFGPGFGGALANPAAKYPRLFGSSWLFRTYPFALPNIVAASIFVVGLIVGFLFLQESLETKRDSRDYGRVIGKLLLRPFMPKKPRAARWQHEEEQSSSLLKHSRGSSSVSREDDIDVRAEPKPIRLAPPSYREVFSYQSNLNLLTYSLLALHSVAYDQLLPIFMHYPPQTDRSSNPNVQLPFKFTGGFGIDSDRIGLLFTLYGIAGMFIQFLIFPPLTRRYGVLTSLKVVTAMFPIVCILTPFTALFPTSLTQQIAMFAVMLVKSWAVIFAFPCTTILLTNSAVSMRVLGTLNGVATSISAIGRAAGPAIAGWTFSIGVSKGYVILPWWTLAGFALLGAITPWWLIEMDGFGGGDDIEDEEEEILEDDNEQVSSRPIDIGHPPLAEHSEEDDDEFASDEDAPLSSQRLSKTLSNGGRSIRLPMRRMSSPIGQRENIGPGGSDRLSNGLGQTRSGLGTGGTPYD